MSGSFEVKKSFVILPLGDSMLPLVSTVAITLFGLDSMPGMSSLISLDGAIVRYPLRRKLSAGRQLRSGGFSLVELMVVVAIVAILAAIAAPSFGELLRRNRLAGASSALQVSLSLARSEAVKRGSDARVTVAANGTAGTWTNGWTVFVDKTSDANGGVGPAADVAGATGVTRLEVTSAPSAPVSIGQTGTLNYFSYNGRGRMIDATGAGVVNRSFWFFDGTSQKYCLVINNTGRVRATRVDASASCPST